MTFSVKKSVLNLTKQTNIKKEPYRSYLPLKGLQSRAQVKARFGNSVTFLHKPLARVDFPLPLGPGTRAYNLSYLGLTKQQVCVG